MGKVNSLERGQWSVTYHKPDGTSAKNVRTPSCEPGPRTDAYLGKYLDQLAALPLREREALAEAGHE